MFTLRSQEKILAECVGQLFILRNQQKFKSDGTFAEYLNNKWKTVSVEPMCECKFYLAEFSDQCIDEKLHTKTKDNKIRLSIDLHTVKSGKDIKLIKTNSSHFHQIWTELGDKKICTVIQIKDNEKGLDHFEGILSDILKTVETSTEGKHKIIFRYRLIAYKYDFSDTPVSNIHKEQTEGDKTPLTRKLPSPENKDNTSRPETFPFFDVGFQKRGTLPGSSELQAHKDTRRVKSEFSHERKNLDIRYFLPSPLSPKCLRQELLLTEVNKVDEDPIYEDMMVATSPEDAIKHLGELLATAINSGDKENAEKYAGNLALSGVRVAITVDTSNIQNKDLEFSIKVFVEDREASGGCISLKVKATDTVMDLKNKMFMKHSFPVEVQKWVIGKRMPQDTETLQKARVTPGQSLYLYLVTAKSVGLKREDVMARKAQMPYHQAQPASFGNQNFNESGDYMMMLPRTPVTPQSGNFQQRSQPSPVIRQAVAQPQPYPHPPHPKDNRGQVHVAPQAEVKTLPARTKDTHQSFEMIDMPTDLGAETNKMAAAAAGETNEIGWTCPDCTYLNKPTWPGCEICTKDRPASYKIPDGYEMTKEEKERLKREQESEQHAKKLERDRQEKKAKKSKENFQRLLEAEEQNLVSNREPFDCMICFDRINPMEGVVLRECLHSFCRNCLKEAVLHNDEANTRCPYQDDVYSCQAALQEREVKALVPPELYEKYLQRSLSAAESRERNSFHCKTADCMGWCIYEDNINFFECPICERKNCLTCKAIHEGMNCKQYQEDLRVRSLNDVAAQQTQQMLKDLLKSGDAMTCPQCDVILQKKDGCDWIKCSICKTEICWVTKKTRWGPMGPGDISGGCGCRINGRKCHVNCNNCH